MPTHYTKTYPYHDNNLPIERQIYPPIPGTKPSVPVPGGGATPGINPGAPAPGSGAMQIPSDILLEIQKERLAQQQADRNFDLRAAALGPRQSMNLNFRQTGRMLGGLTNQLLGNGKEVDPRIREYQRLQEVMAPYANTDFSDPVAKRDAYYKMGQDLMRNGFQSQGFKMIEAAQDLEKSELEKAKIEAEIAAAAQKEAASMAKAGLEENESIATIDKERALTAAARARAEASEAAAAASRALAIQRQYSNVPQNTDVIKLPQDPNSNQDPTSVYESAPAPGSESNAPVSAVTTEPDSLRQAQNVLDVLAPNLAREAKALARQLYADAYTYFIRKNKLPAVAMAMAKDVVMNLLTEDEDGKLQFDDDKLNAYLEQQDEDNIPVFTPTR